MSDDLHGNKNHQCHKVREVHRGDAVLHHMREFKPDVVLHDIGMPGMSGYDAAREIKNVFKESAPVLVVGFEEYVTKPYDPNMLLAMLTALAPTSG